MNIEERLYPENLKSQLLEPEWLRGMKCFPSTVREIDSPILMGGIIDEEGDYVIPEIFIGSDDREYLLNVAELFMSNNGGIVDYVIEKELVDDIIFQSENELFLVKIQKYDGSMSYLLTIGYYGNYGRHDAEIFTEEIREFGVSKMSEYFNDKIPGLGCIYGRSERSTGGQIFFSQEDENEFHLTAFSDDFSQLLQRFLMASSGLTKDVFDFKINDIYPAGVKAYENHLMENPMDTFEFSDGKFLLSLSFGNTLFRLDIYIPKSDEETYEKDNFNLISKFLNFLAWKLTEGESFTKANTFIERSLEFAETKFNLDTAAVLNYKLGKLDNALEYINRSLGLDSEVSDHYVTRAKILIALGDLVSAGNDLNKSIELDENNKEARDLLKSLKS